MGLEEMVNIMTKTMVISDIHIPYQDDVAVEIAKAYAKDFKPDTLIVNGDLVDFYTLSTFDKNPERRGCVQEELNDAKEFFRGFRKAVGPDCNILYTEGNHEQRLQRYLWRNPELGGLNVLELGELMNLSLFNVNFVKVGGDYWKSDTGHTKVGDAIIMHGDNRINGAKGGMNAAYNTMKSMGESVIIGHTHRLSMREHASPYHTWTAVEGGNLCMKTGTADWQQGFVTFQTDGDGKNYDYRLHRIENDMLKEGGTTYYVPKT